MMQGRAVSEKHVAGGWALPGERDLTLIVADEAWLHSRHLDAKLCSSPEKKLRGTWRDSLEVIRKRGWPIGSKENAWVCTGSATFSNKLLPPWHKDRSMWIFNMCVRLLPDSGRSGRVLMLRDALIIIFFLLLPLNHWECTVSVLACL